MTPAQRSELDPWIERLAMQFAAIGGLPLIAGRVVGWLLVCDPEEQSAEQIASEIGASRASLSTNLRLLTGAGMVRMTSKRGERTRYYHIDSGAWERVVRLQISALGNFVDVTRQGIGLMKGQSRSAKRIKAAQDVFTWMARVFDDAPAINARQKDK